MAAARREVAQKPHGDARAVIIEPSEHDNAIVAAASPLGSVVIRSISARGLAAATETITPAQDTNTANAWALTDPKLRLV